MRVLLDTSVLVPAFVAELPQHEAALRCYRRARSRRNRLLVAAHSLAELYAVLTRLPLAPQLTPAVARRLLGENVLEVAEIVDLDCGDYQAVIDLLAEAALTGGTVYDALVVQAARKARAKRLCTFNGADFRRVWPDAGRRLEVLV